MDDILAIAQNLNFDVPGAGDEALQIDRIVAKCRTRLALCQRHLLAQFCFAVRNPNAATTTTGRRLDHDWIANLCRHNDRRLQIVYVPVLPGTVGTPARRAVSRATDLLPMHSMVSALGPTKISPCCVTRRAKAAFSDRKP